VGKKKGSHARAGFVVDLEEAAGVGAQTIWDEDAAVALDAINRAGTMRNFEIMQHAEGQMRKRRITRADIAHGLMMTRELEDQLDRWRMISKDVDGDRLGLVCFVDPDGGVRVQTVF